MPRSACTISQAVDEFIALKTASGSAATGLSYRHILSHLIRSVGPDLGVRSLTPQHIERHLLTGKKARRAVLSPSTYNKERALIKNFGAFLVDRGYTSHNLCSQVKNVKVQPRDRLRLTVEQLDVALECQTHPRDRMTMALVMYTALRASDLAQIRLGDVDLINGNITVTLQKTGLHEVLGIMEELDTEIRRWMVWYQHRTGVAVLPSTWYLLPHKEKPAVMAAPITAETALAVPLEPTRAASYVSLLRSVKRALKVLGLEANYEGLHTIRRSVARIMFDYLCQNDQAKDSAMQYVQSMLGHESMVTTEKYIGVKTVRDKRNAAIRGQSIFGAMRKSSLNQLASDNVVTLRARGEAG